MRERKMKAWIVEEKKWIDLSADHDSSWIASILLGHYKNSLIPVDYIGFQDMNKVDLYETDVVEDNKGTRFVIEWSDNYAGFIFMAIDRELKRDIDKMSWFPNIDAVSNEYKKIGNSLEQPELIEE